MNSLEGQSQKGSMQGTLKADSLSELEQAFERQKYAFAKERCSSYETRMVILKTLYALIDDNSEELVEALNSDFSGRVRQESEIAEIIGSLSTIRYLIKNLNKFMQPRGRHTSIWFLPGTGKVICRPLGVIGVMSPWNYSVHLTIAPMATALAAGNRVMAKMSELTPATTATMKRLLTEALPQDLVTICDGGVEEAKAFSSLEFDHLFFTGSTPVGRNVAQAAARNLTPLTLELGGKSPVIIGKHYDVAEAAKRILWGKTFNAGQTCIAPDYVLVHEDKLGEFICAASATVTACYPDGINNTFTSIINAQHYQRITAMLDDARAHGAEVLPLSEPSAKGKKIPPTLVIQPTPKCRICHEEIFGPVLPVFTFSDMDKAIELIHLNADPLALYIFSKNGAESEYISQQVRAGSVVINDTLLQYIQNDLPFGGVGSSGYGKYHGPEGFDTFSTKQAVFKQRGIGKLTGIKLLYPPYGSVSNIMMKLLRAWP